MATLPDDISTDGQRTASFTFNDFNPGEAVSVGCDYDLYSAPDGNGDPNGTVVVATFSDGSSAQVVVQNVAGSVAGSFFPFTGFSPLLDSTFSSDGKATVAIVGSVNNEFAWGVAAQPDGKIVLGGVAGSGAGDDFAVVRLLADGSPDPSFDSDGKVLTPVGGGADLGRAIALQPDGKIVLAGQSHNGSNWEFAVVRYNPDGSLDTSFNTTGKVITPIGIDNDRAFAVALQPDGKIVVAGYAVMGGIINAHFALVRYNPDGSLDTTFSSDGIQTTAIGGIEDQAFGVVIQPDGKIVAVGYSYNGSNKDIALVRYHADGSLDSSFDGDGKMTMAIGGLDDIGYGITMQPDGKILVAGWTYNASNSDMALLRFNPDGSPDLSFNGSGRVITTYGGSFDFGNAPVVQANGKIVVAGYANNGSNDDFALSRYLPNGSLDTSFGNGGKITTAIGSDTDAAGAVALQPDGKIVAAGYTWNGSNNDMAVARYLGDAAGFQLEQPAGTVIANNTGSISFGDVPLASGSSTRTVTIRNSGGFPLEGLAVAVSGTHSGDFSVVPPANTTLAPGATRTFDVTFDPGGFGARSAVLTVTSTTSRAGPVAIALTGNGTSQGPVAMDLTVHAPATGNAVSIYSATANVTEPDGEAVTLSVVSSNVPGSTSVQNGVVKVFLTSPITSHATITVRATDPHGLFDDAVVLLTASPPGSVDPTFDGDGPGGSGVPSGYGVFGFPGENAVVRDIKAQPDGKVVAVGTKETGAIVTRFNANGTVDSGFGTGGFTFTTSGTSAVFRRMALQPDGKILAVGYSIISGNGRYLVARFTRSGAPDTTFDGDGMKIVDVGPSADVGTDVVIQPDGKIVLSGYSYTGSAYSQSAVRLLSDGTYDTSFDGDGKVIIPYAENSLADAVALMPDGKIVLAGHTNVGGSSDFCTARLLSDGTLDSSFGDGGKRIVSLSAGNDFCESMTVQPDGKLLLGGRIAGPVDDPPKDFALLRLDSNGNTDGSFGTDGKLVFAASPSFDTCWDLAVQPDGKIVAAGIIAGSYEDMAVVRFLANGTPDNSFSGDGILYLAPGTYDDGLYTVEVEADGDIIGGGYSEDSIGVKRMAVVKLNGFGAEPDIAVEHPAGVELTDGGPVIDCGEMMIGQQVSKTFTVRNSGFQTLYLSHLVTVSVPGSFVDTGLSFSSLAPGASGEYTFIFRAQIPGTHTATLRFLSNDPDESPFEITLTCTGTAPEIAVFDGAVELIDGQSQVVDLGETVIGNHLVHSLTIQNPGNAPLTISAIQLPSGLEIQTGMPALPVTIPAGASANLGIFFGTQIGVFQGAVEISCDDSDESVFSFPVSAVVHGIPEIALEHPVGVDLPHGSGLHFGTLASGRGTSAKTVTIKNTGNGPLAISSISITGANPTEFPMTAPVVPLEIAPGGQETLTITFSPAGTTTGGRFGTLEITCDDPDESLLNRSLEGLGLSTIDDNDGDGMNDWAEYRLSAVGFDWTMDQTAMVTALYDGANDAGLFTPAQVQALHLGTPLISRNPDTGKFKLTMDWKKSTNLADFFDFPAPINGVSVNSQGDIEMEFSSPDNAAFFRVEAR